jgi:Protein of unknown function (DUF1501)
LLAGRDHWPTGFSLALVGGGLRGGQVIGATDPEGTKNPVGPTTVEDVHATFKAVGIDPLTENIAPLTGRPIELSPGSDCPVTASARASPESNCSRLSSLERVGRRARLLRRMQVER